MNENHHNITTNNIICSLQRSSSKVTASYDRVEVESICTTTKAKTAIKTTMKNAIAPSPSASASPKNAGSSKQEQDNSSSCTCQGINDGTSNQQPLSSQTKRILSEKARHEVETKFAGILPRHDFALYRLGQFPKFASEELTLGKKLGQGEFGIIKEVRDVKLHQEDETRDDGEEQHESLSERVSNVVGRQDDEQTAMETITDEECRLFIQHFCLRTTTKSKDETKQDEDESMVSDTSNPIKRFFSFDWANNLMTNPYSNKPKGAGIVTARYAIKQQKQLCCTTSKQFYDSVKDMATEAYLLAALEHPFILKLRAVSTAPMGSEHFFVIVDRLVDTLDDKLQNEWRMTQETLQKSAKHKALASALSITNSSSTRQAKQLRKEQRRDFLQERLQVAKDLTSAIKYLHQNHIMDRDLKPHNVGFDIRGDVKLFDFGLSTVFSTSSKEKKHTGRTGSILYMAPENYFGRYYDESVDIYSLAYIIWEMIHLQELFPNYKSISLLEAHVLKGGDRPRAVENKSAAGAMLLHNGGSRKSQIPHLLDQMWHDNPKERPTAEGVYAILKKELHVLTATRGAESMPTSRKPSKVTDNNDDDEQRSSDINIRRSSCFQERFNRASLIANEVLLAAQNHTKAGVHSSEGDDGNKDAEAATSMMMIPVGSFPCNAGAGNCTSSAKNRPNMNNVDCVQRRKDGYHKTTTNYDDARDNKNHHERDLQIIHALMGGSSNDEQNNQDFVELFCV